jgi:signal transduction histidine kinase
VLDDEGLHAAVEAMARTLPITLRHDLPNRRFNPHTEKAAYFMISEGLTNAVKHSGSDTVRVRAYLSDDHLHVEVHDDGVGAADPAGHGLAGIADRMRHGGGRFTVESPPSGGTRLWAVLPP